MDRKEIARQHLSRWGQPTDNGSVAMILSAMDDERERCASLADEYYDWTYWGQDNNHAAATAAAEEIAAAIRLGRPLKPDEIKAVDEARKKRNHGQS